MRLTSVRIKGFRNLRDVEVDLENLTLLCGENSSGKSNVLRAIQFALVPPDDAVAASTASFFDEATLRSPGPNRQLRVDLDFEEVPADLMISLGLSGNSLTYSVRTRTPKQLSYSMNGSPVIPGVAEDFCKSVDVVYVPPIRDVDSSGLEPLIDALSQRVVRTRRYLRGAQTQRESVEQTAAEILGATATDLSVPGPAVTVVPRVKPVPIAETIRGLRISVERNGGELPLSSLGTGHQSEIILSLYEGFQSTSHCTVFLIEEPDNHLHPLLIESTASRLKALGRTAQVLTTSHSPILMNALGFSAARIVRADSDGYASVTPLKRADEAESAVWGLRAYGIQVADAILARRIVLVEGPSDALVLKTYQKARTGVAADRLGVLVVPCGSAGGVAEASSLASALGLPWKAVLDYDACEAGDHPALSSAPVADADQLLVALALLTSHLEPKSKRFKSASSELRKLELELLGTLVARRPDEETPLIRCFKKGGGTASEIPRLLRHLELRQNVKANSYLRPRSVFLMKEDLESAYLKHPAAEQLGKEQLGIDSTTSPRNLRLALKKSRHAKATARFVELLVQRNMLRYSEIESVRSFAFDEV